MKLAGENRAVIPRWVVLKGNEEETKKLFFSECVFTHGNKFVYSPNATMFLSMSGNICQPLSSNISAMIEEKFHAVKQTGEDVIIESVNHKELFLKTSIKQIKLSLQEASITY